jgi:site-specific recombinase XerD
MADSPPPADPPAPPHAGSDPADGARSGPTGPADAAANARAGTPVQALLRPAETGSLGPVWDALADRAAHYATRARGAGTRRTYRSAWTHFSGWCRELGREPLGGDPDLVAMYVVRRADDGLTVSSIRVALAAIRTAYQLAGVPLDLTQPRFRMTLEGVVRSRGVRPTRQAALAVPDVLTKMLAALPAPDAPLGIRNRAMLLLGFGAALRRSELVGLRIGDVQRVAGRGLTVLVRRSKTDQHGRGQQVAIWANSADPLTCPAAALERWMALRDTAPDVARCFGPEGRGALTLFCGMSKAGRLSGRALSDKAVARLVKTAAASAGLDAESYSGHSLRAGLATAAGDQGAGLADLMRQTRHKSTEIALGYLRPADLWRNNVTEGLLRPKDRQP